MPFWNNVYDSISFTLFEMKYSGACSVYFTESLIDTVVVTERKKLKDLHFRKPYFWSKFETLHYKSYELSDDDLKTNLISKFITITPDEVYLNRHVVVEINDNKYKIFNQDDINKVIDHVQKGICLNYLKEVLVL